MAEDDAPRNTVPSDDPLDPQPGSSGEPSSAEPPDSGPEAGATAQQPPLDQTVDAGPLDQTARPAPLDETQVGSPPVPDAGPTGTGVLPPVASEPPRWSARAQVPQRDLDDDGYGAWSQTQWQEVEEQRRPGTLAPVLITLVVVLLVALIALGVWLSLRGRDTPVTPPSATPTPAPAVPTTTAPAPTTSPPSPTPAAEVEIPAVRTLSYEEAVDRLAAAGFTNVARVDEVSDLPAGQVIDTNPPAGTRLRPGTAIEIRVSTGLPETTTAGPTTPPAAD